MRKLRSLFIAVVYSIFFITDNFAQNNSWKWNITPFTDIGHNALGSVSGYNFLYQAGSIGASAIIIKSGLDYKVHNYFSENKSNYNSSSIPAVYIGYTVPAGLGGFLYFSGLYNNNPKSAAAGCAVLQASLLAWAETSLLKAFTGRQNPDDFVYTKENDKSQTFRPGIMRNGIHYGWPSGHLAVTTAVVSSLTNFYFDNTIIKVTSWSMWAYMLYGVTVHDGNTMHWFSDVVTGSMMGYAIGSTVGKNFRKLYNNTIGVQETGYFIAPQINYNYLGLNFSYKF